MQKTETTELSNWGRFCRREAERIVATEDELSACLARAPVLPRGGGRSYGDAGIGPKVLELQSGGPIELDTASGVVRVAASVTLDELLREVVPRGFIPSAIPGTRFATVGGCIAADVHGKDHHVAGSFGHQVRSLELYTPSGEKRTLHRSDGDPLMDATLGGMGLTGFIGRAELELHPIESPWIRRRIHVGRDIDEMVELVARADSRYAVAWIDGQADGAALGRGFAIYSDHVPMSEAPDGRAHETPFLSVPLTPPARALVRPAIVAFNELCVRNAKRIQAKGGDLVHYEYFLWPLDRVKAWNRLYGPRGMVELHFVVPNAGPGFRRIMQAVRSQLGGAFLGILKVLKEGAPERPLSFPAPGPMLILDIPIFDELPERLEWIHRMIRDEGGRVYLAKDALMSAELFRSMYPRVDAFLETKAQVDPEGWLRGDQSERLGLT